MFLLAVPKANHSDGMAAPTLLRSRKMISRFAVHVPTTAGEAISLKRAYPGSIFMAGGIEVADQLKYGAACSDVIRLDRIDELKKIAVRDGLLRIGAAARHQMLAAAPLVRQHIGGFADAIAGIGSPRIRVQGTIGGNIMSRAPHYDVLPMLISLSARLIFIGTDGVTQDLPAEAGVPDDQDALLAAIDIPVEPALSGFLFERVDKPVLSLAVTLSCKPSGILATRVVHACPGQSPTLRTFDIDTNQRGALADSVSSWSASLPDFIDDRHASCWYRQELSQVRLRRLLANLCNASRGYS